jgi:hypothetical protein
MTARPGPLLAAFLLLPGLVASAAEPLPLLAAVAELECGRDEAAARKALTALRDATTARLGLPSEQLNVEPPLVMHLAVLDIALLGLAEAAAQRPELAGDIDALVRSWNFCLVLGEANAWDVEVLPLYGPRRTWPVTPAPTGGEGLRRWGLDPKAAGYAPRRAPAGGQPLPARCVEGKGTGLYAFIPPVRSGPLPIVPEAVSLSPMLMAPPGEQQCRIPAPEPLATEVKLPATAPAPPPSPVEDDEAFQEPHSLVAVPTSSSAVTPGVPVVVRRPSAFSGALFASQRLSGPGQLGATLRWNPVGRAFMRASLSYGLLDEDFRFTPDSGDFFGSWGLGWEDWRPNTFSFTLNNWGPVRLDSIRSAWETTEFDAVYRVPLPGGLRRWLDVGTRLNVPFNRKPGVGVSLTGKPLRNVYLMTSVRVPLLGDEPVTWTYTLGYASWQPYTFTLNFANWGPNRLSELNLMENGLFTVAFLWAPR